MMTTAVFDKPSIEQGNIKPVLQITSPDNPGIGYVTPANITISGSAFDMDGSISRTEIFMNDSLISSLKSSPFNFILKNVKTGDYTIKIKTVDNSGAETNSDELIVTVKEKSEKLPFYKFDENKLSYFSADASGNNLNAVLLGAGSFTEGKINNGLLLDGIDDYARLPSTFIHLLSEFSISTWVKLDELRTWVRIFDFGQGTNSYMMLTADNGTGITFELKSGLYSQKLSTMQKPATGTWNFYSVTLADNTLSIYLNGNLIGKNTNFTLRPYDIGSSFGNYLGKSQWTADPLLKGTIDEFRFFNYALTPDEITTLMLGQTALQSLSGSEISIYPNPARNTIFIKNAIENSVSLFDSTGHLIRNFQISETIHSENINNLQSGYYFIVLKDLSGKRYQKKIIIK